MRIIASGTTLSLQVLGAFKNSSGMMVVDFSSGKFIDFNSFVLSGSWVLVRDFALKYYRTVDPDYGSLI